MGQHAYILLENESKSNVTTEKKKKKKEKSTKTNVSALKNAIEDSFAKGSTIEPVDDNYIF